MKLFEVLSIYNILSKIPFKGNDSYLTNDLKRKIIANKVKYGKFKTEFESTLQEFSKDYVTEDMVEKIKADKEYAKQIESELFKYQSELLQEDKEIEKVTLTEDEYNNIVDVAFDDIELNGVTIPVQDFLEILYNTFVTKE